MKLDQIIKVTMGAILPLVFVYVGDLFAEVYRSVDAEGNVTYSDTPHAGATKIDVPSPTIIPSTRAQTKLKPDKQKKTAVPYTSLSIVQPADESTLRNVQSVSVRAQISPNLQTSFGHRAQILFNGQPLGSPGAGLSATINDIERGAHTLQVVVTGKDGATIDQSPVSRFYLHKNSVGGGQ